jgi:hypothetical protein
MDAVIVLTLKVYLLAAVISMAVAVAIRGIVMALSHTGAQARASASAKPTGSSSQDEPHIAAIGAAIYTLMGDHRIISIRARGAGWAAGGRAAHHGSHNVSRR